MERPPVRNVFELDVYRMAYQASLEVHSLSLKFPKIEQYGGMADQMRRASKGICANLAEGWGKWSTAEERRRFVRIALGSATEMQVWLHYCRDLKYLDEIQPLIDRYEVITRMLVVMVRP